MVLNARAWWRSLVAHPQRVGRLWPQWFCLAPTFRAEKMGAQVLAVHSAAIRLGGDEEVQRRC